MSKKLDFEGLLDAAPDAMVGVDQGGVILFVNRQTLLFFGYDRDDLVGRPIETLVPESFRNVHPGHRAGYFADSKARPMGAGLQVTGRRQDGTEFPVDVILSHFGAGDDVLVIAAVRDVTEQRHAAETARSLVAAEYLVRTVMGSASIGIAVADLDGKVQVVNRSLCTLLGYDEAWFLAHRLRDLVHPDDAEEGLRVDARFLAGSIGMIAGQLRLVRADGATVWVRRVVVRIPSGDGQPELLMVQVENITAEHDAQEALTYQAFHDPLTALRT